MFKFNHFSITKQTRCPTQQIQLQLLTVVLEKTLESSLDSKEIKSVHPKGNQPEYSLEELMMKLKFQYFGYLMGTANSLEKTLMLGKVESKRRMLLEEDAFSCILSEDEMLE